jgi:hypothetical protein
MRQFPTGQGYSREVEPEPPNDWTMDWTAGYPDSTRVSAVRIILSDLI